MSKKMHRTLSTRSGRAAAGASLALAASFAASLTGCSSGATTEANTLTVSGDVAIAYAKRVNTIRQNPTNGAPSANGGDLIIREKSSASAIEHNMTAQFTQGAGDVASPDISYDGKKIVFAMRCPSSSPAQVDGAPACTGHWNIWEYDMTTGGLTGGTFKRITRTGDSDDTDPTYLPAGKGYVFTSNRQLKSSQTQALGYKYYALDEYERERVFNLHTADANGGNITQITFSQSHDRSPTVRPNGDIMFSHWDHVAGRNHFKVFTAKPDGTNLFVLYGAHSTGNSFLHPRDMDPSGKYKGFLTTDLMPLTGSHEGGGLMFIDAANFSEEGAPVSPGVTGPAQVQATAQQLSIGGGISQYGFVTTPYPLWDGSNRVLVSYRPCEVTRKGVTVSCTTLTAAEMARISSERLVADIQADEIQNNVPPPYAVYMFDPAQQTFLIVAAPPPGFMYTHPVAILPHAEPNAVEGTPVDATLAAQNLGILEVRSIFDTDGLGRMGDNVLTGFDLPAGCTTSIAKTAPTDPLDTRGAVADIARIKDPASPAYGCAPGRFVRAVRAVAPPNGMTGLRGSIGETEFEMQQILGYAPIEPDGSFKLQVPADTPIALAIVDDKGRAFQTHTNWIQVRPGERRTCDGCHSPRRGGALNSGAVVNNLPAAVLPAMTAAHQSGETMAGTRTRLDANAMKLGADMVYSDIWADVSKPGVKARPSIMVKYTGNADPANDLVTAAPVNGIINYDQHVQPLWSRPRGPNGSLTCTNCHNDPDKLDLTGTPNGIGRVNSYDKLMVGDPAVDADGKPLIFIEEGVEVVKRNPARVDTMASEGEALGLARKSRLGDILWGQKLFSGAGVRALYPDPPASAPDHSKLLNAAELRLAAEWMELGGKYDNDPYKPGSLAQPIHHGLSGDVFAAQIEPILVKTCANACHQGIGSKNNDIVVGTSFRDNRLVLTGDAGGDYGVVTSLISNTCNAASNTFLKKPSTVPHPRGATKNTTPILPVGSTDYNTIAAWIATGC